jgi:hypothetical protein
MENNIDKIFRNKLASLQEKPSDAAWARLEEAMYGKQIKRKNRAIYWQVAAAVALLLSASFFYFGNEGQNKITANLTDKQEIKKEIYTLKETETTTAETYQPIEKEPLPTNKKHAVAEQIQVNAGLEKQNNVTPKEELLAQVNTPQTTEKEETTLGYVGETTALNAVEEIGKQANAPKQEETLRVTVKFVEEEQIQAEAEEIAEKQEKKTWLGKMVANIKKKRQKERAEETMETSADSNTEREKTSVFVFGIDTEKIFAKKKSDE